jgi:hypothetical protein
MGNIDNRKDMAEQLQSLRTPGRTISDELGPVTPEIDTEAEQRARLDAEARHAAELGKIKYSTEAATALNQAVNPALNALAHRDLRNHARTLIFEFAQRLEDCNLDFHRTMFLGDMCWKFNQYLENTRVNQTKSDHEIAKLVDDGSEIGMRQATRKLRFKDELDHQESVLETLVEAAEDAYFELIGRPYLKPTKRDLPGVDVERARVKMIADRVKAQAAKTAAPTGSPSAA